MIDQNGEFHHCIIIIIIIWSLSNVNQVYFKKGFLTKKGIWISKIGWNFEINKKAKKQKKKEKYQILTNRHE